MGTRPRFDEAGVTREGTLSLGGPGLVGGRDAREWTPDDLQIAGLVPMSTVDWPGKFVASLFLQGCPWACPYCHNSAIIDPRIPGVVAWSALEDLLARRRGLLDGVVFSGGEATRQIVLGAAMARVRELGFGVGLHTAGPYPRRLEELLGAATGLRSRRGRARWGRGPSPSSRPATLARPLVFPRRGRGGTTRFVPSRGTSKRWTLTGLSSVGTRRAFVK